MVHYGKQWCRSEKARKINKSEKSPDLGRVVDGGGDARTKVATGDGGHSGGRLRGWCHLAVELGADHQVIDLKPFIFS